jgi:2-polyprenyl-3-methyl-5-hydroxy-6-metoxy-1,4-benzoquinol methylase
MADRATGALVKSIACEPGDVRIFALDGNRFRVVLEPKDPALFIPFRTADTSLSLEILELLIARCEYQWLCDVLARFDDSGYLAKVLKRQLFAYFTPADFEGKRLLDFGCGSGNSSMIMAGWLPRTEIVGVELEELRVDTARRIAAMRQVPNVSFYTSPTPDSLAPEVGTCDFIMLSAVYEHLLPNERRSLMPMLWSALKPGGSILINQTPCRWFPFEHHTTGLWFINYLPDFLACYVARHFSRESPETNRNLDWNGLLRHGVRGGTERQMLRNLSRGNGRKGRILQPAQGGYRDRADLWLSAASPRHAGAKKIVAAMFRMCDRLTGMVPSSHVEVVIQKPI